MIYFNNRSHNISSIENFMDEINETNNLFINLI